MYIVMGLGNPGVRYEKTRHNVGFMVVERLAQALDISLSKRSRLMRWGEGMIVQERVILVEPLTYMNNSGLVAKKLLRAQEAAPERLIVIYDDLDLEPGQIRIRQNGGSGGHGGIRSIMGQISSENFMRVRVGIGRPPGRQDPADYVLSPFSKSEWEEIALSIDEAGDAVFYIIVEGVARAMNEFNRRREDW
ncbi:MAG: aminoacyl-tRNA hydrolase [Actinobacteria bacterium]|nr:aminoacyl-tRNA hydrolase [Actinomycetota bacterium]